MLNSYDKKKRRLLRLFIEFNALAFEQNRQQQNALRNFPLFFADSPTELRQLEMQQLLNCLRNCNLRLRIDHTQNIKYSNE